MSSYSCHPEVDLSQFQDQYWFNKNPSFAFHFNRIQECFSDFENNAQVWHNVKSIQLPTESLYKRNFIEELQIKIPQLTFIRFSSFERKSVIETQSLSQNPFITKFKTLPSKESELIPMLYKQIQQLNIFRLTHLMLDYTSAKLNFMDCAH